VFLSIAREKYGIESRDEIRQKLTWEQYRDLHVEAARRIRDMAEKSIVVLDTHALVALPTGFMPGFPFFVLKELPVSAWVLIEASAEEIRSRRARDAGARERGEGLEANIELHQSLNRMAAVAYAVIAGGTVYIIKNREGKADEAARELAEVIKKCSGSS